MTMKDLTKDSLLIFQNGVRASFEFLEKEYLMVFTGVREIKEDPRDAGFVARYRTDEHRIEIGWSEYQLSLVISIRFSQRDDLPRNMKFVYFEPYVEFSSRGKEQSIVPQIYPRMGGSRIIKTVEKRQELFKNKSLSEVLRELANKLHNNIDTILNAKDEQIRNYHKWFNSGGKLDYKPE